MAATLADFFDGRVQQEEYFQPLEKAAGGNYYGVFKAQTFRFEGVPASLADTTGSVSVTDVGGASYTLSLTAAYTDSSGGSAFFPKEQIRVTRSRMSPHMWIITVSRTGGELRQGNAVVAYGPSWMYD